MNKPALIKYIESLSLGEKLTKFLVSHIQESDMNQELLDRVASVIDLVADMSFLQEELWQGELDALEQYADSLDNLDQSEKQESSEILENFLNKIEKLINDAKTTQPSQV